MFISKLSGTATAGLLGAIALSSYIAPAAAVTTVIPANSFSSYALLEQYWGYLYPWGSDHNGSARMKGSPTDHSNIQVASNTLSLISMPTVNPIPPTSTANPHPAIHYSSGAIHAKQYITVTPGTSYTLYGEFSSPTVRGTWPAFWLTGVNSWPPEIDIGEWKGTNDNWYNTFNSSSSVHSDLVSWPADLSFHSIKAVLTPEADGADVKIDFYMDNVYRATQYGSGFVNQPLWLILNFQMEGSSGSPGPTGTSFYKIRNFSVTKTP